jgi:SpoVK/Ycf46/Vps4 family AAA+-type ATPase
MQQLTTGKVWNEKIFHPAMIEPIKKIIGWLQDGKIAKEDLGTIKNTKKSFSAIFYGPGGAGKKTTAAVLGKLTQREVYRVDLSKVVSKYIGETEKNLSKIFESAENKNWILFFDEADALFGKRTTVRDAHDKYANREIDYLLQRIEEYNGLVILSTNKKSNIDDAFIRRIRLVIQFPLLRKEE